MPIVDPKTYPLAFERTVIPIPVVLIPERVSADCTKISLFDAVDNPVIL